MTTKNKTITAFLALFLGTLGVHRFYLKGWSDPWAWLHIVTTAIGLYGVSRIFALGQDDQVSWVLVPLLGLSITAAGLAGVVIGLMNQDKWNQNYIPAKTQDYETAGRTTGLTIFAVILSLLFGATALMSTIAFTGQRYFEYSLKKSVN